MDRRRFLKSSAATMALAVSGCGYSSKDIDTESMYCTRAPSGVSPVVDMHCHILTGKDLDAAEFAIRRHLNADEEISAATRRIFRQAGGRFLELATYGAPSLRRERNQILKVLRTREAAPNPDQSLRDLCAAGLAVDRKRYIGFSSLTKYGLNGFAQGRITNALQLMKNNPSVELFTPALIDLFEGTTKTFPYQEMLFYSALNLASYGRFVPLISFTPERQYEADKANYPTKKGKYYRPLELVKRAIREFGFIGVKVHASSGYSPLKNLTYGCLNTEGQNGDNREGDQPDDDLFRRFQKYDEYMLDLFRFCMRYDVPILCHGSTGIMANTKCMTHERPRPLDPDVTENDYFYRPKNGNWKKAEELEWTNSPRHWVQAMDHMEKLAETDPELQGRQLRICLGHLSNGYEQNEERTIMNRPPVVSKWLEYVMQELPKRRGLYVDLGEISDMIDPKKKVMDKVAIKALRDVLRSPGFASRTMYGSDWHMPEVTLLKENYFKQIEAAVPASMRAPVMGGTAMRFFGLAPGHQNRKRLERFYQDPPAELLEPGVEPDKVAKTTATEAPPFLDVNQISWWNKTG